MEYQTLTDCEGIELESEKPFRFACCDCGLVHDVVIVSADGDPVGFAVKRNDSATATRRQSIQADTLDMLYTVLPYIEDAEKDPAYKSGVVAALTRRLRQVIKAAEGGKKQ